MPEQTTTLDLAERIAEAMSRTGEPKQCNHGPQVCEDFNVFGTVPTHLRHLFNLMEEVAKEFDGDPTNHKAEIRLDVVKFVFFTALEERLEIPPTTPYAICVGWEVIELKAGSI